MINKKTFAAVFAAILAAAFAANGCAGGGSSSNLQPPPPGPDFAISVSPGSVTVAQGATSSAIQVNVQPLNGFSGEVTVTLGGVPSGVAANPQSPFGVAAGSNVSLLLGASSAALAGNDAIAVQATSGNLSHSTNLALTIQNGLNPPVPRTSYMRTDSQAALDEPPGEPHHRHLAYDSANQHVFVANRARNRVEVLSTADLSRAGSVDVAGASSADISTDGKTVWIGTLTQEIAAVDTSLLQRVKTVMVSGLQPLPNTVFDRPEEVIALSSGKLLVRLRQASRVESLLALLDPASQSLTDLTSLAPQVFQAGVGVLARSGDHTRVLVSSNDGSGTAMVLDANAAILAGPKSIGSGSLLFVAGNSDGSNFAVILSSGGGQQVVLLDGSLNTASTALVSDALGLAFSSDGQSLLVAQHQNGVPVVSVLAATDLHLIRNASNPSVQGIPPEIEETSETGLAFGLANRGVAFLDTTQGVASATAPPSFAAPAAAPDDGTNVGGAAVNLTGQNFASNPIVHFGDQNAMVTASNAAQIQVMSPPNVFTGTVNISAYFSNGSIALAPDAFSYGPQIVQLVPNAAKSSGGDPVAIYGYGFGQDPGKLTVKFGSATATVQKIDDLSAIATSLGLDSSYPFPLQRAIVTVPSGSAGKSDLSVISAAGSATATQAFQYLQSSQLFAKPGFYKFLLYDQRRQWLYLSNIDHLDVFDLGAGMFRAGILPPGGPPPDSLIRQASLTPDASQLLIADFGAQSLYLVQPDTGAGSSVLVGGIPGSANSGPVRVAATSASTAFVGLASYDNDSSSCSTCLQQLDLNVSPVTVGPAPQPQVSILTSAPLLDASTDGSDSFFAFAAAPGQPMAGWKADSPGQFQVAQTNTAAQDIAAAGDGSFFASSVSDAVEIRDANLALRTLVAGSELENIPQRTNVPGMALHPSGALLYVPFLTGAAPAAAPFTNLQGGVDILDAHTGRLRLRVMLPEPLAMLAADRDGLRGRFLAIDENGQRIFALTSSGLSVVQLSRVPLAIGTIQPSSGASSAGTALTIRGSGFQKSATATLGGKTAAVNFIDMNTLEISTPALSSGPQRLIISNPDRESVSLDAAYIAN